MDYILNVNIAIKHLKNSNTYLTHKDKNIIITKTKSYNEKKNVDLIEKKRLAELRKNNLDQLQKTTREIAKASVKKKVFK